MGNSRYPCLGKSAGGQFLAMFLIALVACVISSPFNELRGYTLQPPSRKKSFGEFFKPAEYIRSTFVGATNLAPALGTGRLVVEPVKILLTRLRDEVSPVGIVNIIIAIYSASKAIKGNKANAENNEVDMGAVCVCAACIIL